MIYGNVFLEYAKSNIKLYHGSSKQIKSGYIDPKNESREKEDYVFGTPYREYALCFAGKPWNDSMLNLSRYNGKWYLTEKKKGTLKKIYDTKGYIYTVNSKDFSEKRNDREYMAKNKVEIKKTETIDNVYNEIINSDINVYEYPDKPSWMK